MNGAEASCLAPDDDHPWFSICRLVSSSWLDGASLRKYIPSGNRFGTHNSKSDESKNYKRQPISPISPISPDSALHSSYRDRPILHFNRVFVLFSDQGWLWLVSWVGRSATRRGRLQKGNLSDFSIMLPYPSLSSIQCCTTGSIVTIMSQYVTKRDNTWQPTTSLSMSQHFTKIHNCHEITWNKFQ